MNKDPEEMNDLSEFEEYHTKVNDLFDDLIILQEELNDTLDLSHLSKIVTLDYSCEVNE